jgi:1-acyl-sn-glycerol-3-phosphate acyltransferase
MKYIFKFLWKFTGWKIVGDVPRNVKKYIIIVAPHSSNWDFIIGVLVRGVLGFDSKFLGKHSLFAPPFGWFFRMAGGYPVDRSQKTNLVDQVVELFDRHEEFIISLAPEGTRKNVSEWKTGFYYIAHKAKVPVVPVKMDRPNRQVIFFKPYYLKGGLEEDMKEIKKVFV